MTTRTEPLAPHPDISEVIPLSKDDEECMRELKAVLVRHGALQRFGVTLLHQHFSVGDDEVLLESVDAEARILTMAPVKVAQLEGVQTLETSWRLDTSESTQRCETQCARPYGPSGPHIPQHFMTG